MGMDARAKLCFGFCSNEEGMFEYKNADGEDVGWYDSEGEFGEDVEVGIYATYDCPVYYICTRGFSTDWNSHLPISHLPEITAEEISRLKAALLKIRALHEETYMQLTDNGENTEPYWFLCASYG
jgi:hypothetical protein